MKPEELSDRLAEIRDRFGDRQQVSVAEAAAFLDVKPRTLRSRIQDGALKAERVGVKMLVINVEDLARQPRAIRPQRGRATTLPRVVDLPAPEEMAAGPQ